MRTFHILGNEATKKRCYGKIDEYLHKFLLEQKIKENIGKRKKDVVRSLMKDPRNHEQMDAFLPVVLLQEVQSTVV